ncbi:DUF262 domain-containing protein [Nocardia harenae]|uniref:DUF262 domain-containing protein n=1 Tax=Nocardia harenae TaxID=358707 RepID=UPI00082CD723|nr:DUF262 domain-containing protein [Nocardia harenae]
MAVDEELGFPFEEEEPVEEVFDGRATGVEVERPADASADERDVQPWDPEKIRVATKSFSLRNVLDMIDSDDIELAPDFQRNKVWKPRQKSRLIESLLLQIPLPAFYFAEDEDGLLRVVDGLQRLSTIHEYAREEAFPLKDLEYLRDEHGKSFSQLSSLLKRRLLNAQIVTHVIDPSTPHEVKYDIFKRINTGGEPLNAMEIRHCMSRTRSRELLKRCVASPSFNEATGHVLKDHVRMHDREAALRFIAFRRLGRIEEYDRFGSLEQLLDATTTDIDNPELVTDAQLDGWFNDLERAMVNARAVFGDHAFRKWPTNSEHKSPINRALFESWGVVLADYDRSALETNREKIVELARKAMTKNVGYIAAISTSTADSRRVKKRFEIPRIIMKSAMP